VFVWLLGSCDPAKRLASNEYLLEKNKIIVKDDQKLNTDVLRETIRQKPNRKLLSVFPFYVWAYNVPEPSKAEEKNEKRREKLARKNARRARKGKKPQQLKPYGIWWQETVGEAPVIFDSASTSRSEDQLETWLIKHGWFDAEVRSKPIFNDRKNRVTVEYHIEPKTPYKIRSLSYQIDDPSLEEYTRDSRAGRVSLKQGDQFNIDVLDKERELLNFYFRNKGYYNFNKELIFFDVDSALNSHQVDLTLGIIPRKVPYEGDPDSLITVPYKRYKVESVSLIDQPRSRDLAVTRADTFMVKSYQMIDQHQLRVNRKILAQNILFRPGEYYELDKVTRTYQRMSSFPIVRSSAIQFFPVNEDLSNDLLDCRISLTPAPKQNISLEWNGTNRGGFLGIAGTLTYLNKNIFGRGETLNINLTGGLEAQQLLTGQGSTDGIDGNLDNSNYFNTVEFGPEISITFPTFLLPVKADRFAKSADPKTRLTANLSYQRRPDYERTRSFGSIAYIWSESETKKWTISPIEVSLISIDRSPEFDEQLQEIGDPFLINSFQDHFIVDTRVTYTLSTRGEGAKSRNLYYYRAEVESAGNLLRAAFDIFGAPRNENGNFEILDIEFAQYLKTIHDFRYYREHTKKMSTAYRFAGGIGVPLRNLNVLPFEKSFFGGGANDIRAWQARTLGPGSFRDPERNFDKIGDILIEANVEYRFALIDVLEGALFVDAGNIWTVNSDPSRPGADFEFNRFLSEIAVGVGFGARLNFDFFLIRFDLGLQVKDPSLDPGERWLFQPKDQYNSYIDDLNENRPPDQQLGPYRSRWNFNLGIGYPF
jgi:outer membrane protein assembly factor BamA